MKVPLGEVLLIWALIKATDYASPRLTKWLWRVVPRAWLRVRRMLCRHREHDASGVCTFAVDEDARPFVHVETLRFRRCANCGREEVRRGSEWKLSPRDPFYKAPKPTLFP